MSFDGFVVCNCVRDGLLKTPPPFPAKFDENIGSWELETPEAQADPEGEVARQQQRELFGWARTACDHPFQKYTSVGISGNWGMRTFYSTILKLGADNYPTLAEYLPHHNEGFVPADQVAAMREEILRYQQQTYIGTSTRLVDSTTNTVIRDGGGDFSWNNWPSLTYGFDQNGFYVIHDEDTLGAFDMLARAVARSLAGADSALLQELGLRSGEIFRSMRFDQRPDGLDIGDAPHFVLKDGQDVHLIDVETGFTLVVQQGITRREDFHDVYPRQLHVETVPYGAERVYYVTERILELCDAALEIGGRIMWA